MAITQPGLPVELLLYSVAFDLPRASNVHLAVHDVTGKLVCMLVDENLDAGHKSIIWNGRNRPGQEVVSGVYFYTLTAAEKTITRKMILLR
jgi:flagellar hook assembly protein FlgD